MIQLLIIFIHILTASGGHRFTARPGSTPGVKTNYIREKYKDSYERSDKYDTRYYSRNRNFKNNIQLNT